VWNNRELPKEWKESIIVPIYKKGYKTDCSKQRGISLFSTTYTILSNILLSMLTPYAEEIIGDHRCKLRGKRSTTDHIFCIRPPPSKAVPLQAWTGPEGSTKLRLPDFVTTAQDGGRLSALRTGRFYPQ